MKEGRILVVDDEPQIIRFLRPALDAAGYDMLEASTGAEALRKAATLAPDIMILDLGLPDMDGKDVVARVRAFSELPILILSARDRESEKIAALDLGADDYIEKPFRIGELLARIRTALRHHGKADRQVTRIVSQGLVIDFEHRLVTHHGRAIKLTPKEYDLLAILARNAGKVLTHRTLLTAVWDPPTRRTPSIFASSSASCGARSRKTRTGPFISELSLAWVIGSWMRRGSAETGREVRKYQEEQTGRRHTISSGERGSRIFSGNGLAPTSAFSVP